jgi:PIN domain nuclease of toxin-antitoxin system
MILDTCALLWLAHDRSRISKDTLLKIDEAPVVFIAAISGFEIGLKCRSGKLHSPGCGERIRQPMSYCFSNQRKLREDRH